MRWMVMVIAIVSLPGVAWADEAVEIHAKTAVAPAHDDGPPSLDSVARPNIAGTDGQRDVARRVFTLGPRTRATIEGTWWETERDVAVHDRSIDPGVVGHGYQAAVRVSHDLGILGLRVGASAAIGHVDTRDGRGTFTEFAASLGRTFHIARWMTGWISLDVGQRTWHGKAPPGEADARQVSLSIGTTF